MECLLRILTIILLFTSGYTIRVNYLIGVPRLGNTNHWDYYFSCNTEGQTLQWEVNRIPLVGFNTNDVGRVSYSSKNSFKYTAAVLTSRPISGRRQAFDSVLIVSVTSPTNLDVTCRNGTSSNGTDNTIAGISDNSTDFSNSVALQYFMKVGVVSENSTTSIFICGINSTTFLQWMTDTNLYTFLFMDDIGTGKPNVENVNETLKELPILIASEPYQIVSVLFVSGSSDITVRCRSNDEFLDFSASSQGPIKNTEPVSDAINFTSGSTVGINTRSTNTRSIDRIRIVAAIVPTAVIIIFLVCIFVVVIVLICKKLNKKSNEGLQENNEEERKKAVNPQGTEHLQENDNEEEKKEGVKCRDTEDLQESDIEEEKNNAESVNPQHTEDLKESDKEEDGKQELRVKYLQPKYVKDFKKEWKKKSIKYEYEFLRKESTVSSTTEAQKHKDKNRYPKVLPFDSTRVKLDIIEGVEGSDYINASFIDGYESSKAYIAAQSPLPDTLDDFWRMIYEQQVTTIVMFDENVEKLCPKNEGQMQVYGNIQVTCKKMWCITNFEVREFELDDNKESGSQETKHCKYYRFLSWPAHGIPQFPTPLIQFILEVKSHHKDSPIVVLSEAGIGRAGVFITLHAIMERIEDEKEFNVFKFVKQMRSQRKHMVNSMDEYLYIYNVLHEVCICNDGKKTSMDAQALRKKIKDNPIAGETEFMFLEGYIDKWMEKMLAEPIELKSDDDNYGLLSTYRNAVSLHGYTKENAYIAAPIPTTTATRNDFWHLIWEQKSQVIVVLDSSQGAGLFEHESYDELIVSLDEQLILKDYLKWTCHISQIKTDNIQVVTLYQYENWQENKPSSSKIAGIVKFISELQQNINNYDHIVVMSQSGDDHTGMFITIHAMIEKVQIDHMVDFFQFIMLSRVRKYKLIKNLKEYQFCHKVLAEYMETM